MNILSIEKARNELISFLENTGSRRLKAKRISEFFALLIEQKSYSLIESYLLEFMPRYLDYLKTYSPIGVNPDFTESIIRTNTKLIEVIESAEYKEKLGQLNLEIENKLLLLNKVLAGEQAGITEERKAFFPLIEDEEGKSITNTIGAIDSITIKLSKAKQRDKFIIVPSEAESDKLLEEQINICWEKAMEFCKKHIRKISPYHEVIISFDGNLGIYQGESLGAALTIAMIEELLRYNNSPTVLEPISNAAFTGGLNENGEIKPVKKEIIQKKAEIVFYSNCEVFAVPKEDESYAVEKIEELKQKYSNRKIETVGVKTLNEILLRRDLVEIKKQKLIVRTSKFVKKNWVSAVVTVLLAVMFGYLFVMDWDDNPFSIVAEYNKFFVKNKNGKILWFKKISFPQEAYRNKNVFFATARIIDINNDGINEVIYKGTPLSKNKNEEIVSRVFCCDFRGNVLWEYTFDDSVSCDKEPLDRYYSIFSIIDTVTIHNVKSIMLVATSTNHFTSPIFRLNLETGERLPGTLWCSGFVVEAIIKDIDNNGKMDILAAGVDNGFEDVVIFSYEIDTLTRVRFSTKEYTIKEYPLANLKTYIRLPKVDFENYIGSRFSGVKSGRFYDKLNERKYAVTIGGEYNSKPYGYWAKLDYNLKDFDFVIDNEFRVFRDTLVVHGKLSLPYTDTEEYKQILRSNILYWHNDKWVKREELE